MLDLLLTVVGLAGLFGGGEFLVRGASRLALRFGVSPVVIGLTVVAFGTSAPELVVNLSAAWRGESAIGFGNVVGSNIANIGLLVGVTAILIPLAIPRSIVSREIPMLLLACAAALVLGLDGVLTGGTDGFSRADGLILLLLFAVFLYYTAVDALREGASTGADGAASTAASVGIVRVVFMIVAGLALLIVGAELTVAGASSFALALGVPEVTVGLTIVAVGTSLPELATTLVAARRGNTEIAVGNIVGSNIFNLLFIWGLTVTIAPAGVPVGGRLDMLAMTALALVLLPMAITQRKISRLEGAALLVGYAVYIGWLAARQV